jgi:RNA polymerase sigma factor (sigma-70 family)
MELSADLLQELKSDWDSVGEEIRSLLRTVQPADRELMGILNVHQPVAESWAGRVEGLARLRSAVIELLLWHLHKNTNAPVMRKELLGALWQKVVGKVEFRAKAMVKNLPVHTRRQEGLEEFLQEGFFQFEEALRRYDPTKKEKHTMLRTFVSTFYRYRMINISKSKAMKKGRSESLAESDLPIDESQTDRRIKDEQREAIERALTEVADADPRDAERVVAFRKYMIEGGGVEEIAQELGRSRSWVTKSHQHIRTKLRETLLR